MNRKVGSWNREERSVNSLGEESLEERPTMATKAGGKGKGCCNWGRENRELVEPEKVVITHRKTLKGEQHVRTLGELGNQGMARSNVARSDSRLNGGTRKGCNCPWKEA